MELVLNDEQMRIYQSKLDYVRDARIDMLSQDDVARICHQLDFDEAKINAKLATYVTESKYRVLEEFEWQTSLTPAEKKAAK